MPDDNNPLIDRRHKPTVYDDTGATGRPYRANPFAVDKEFKALTGMMDTLENSGLPREDKVDLLQRLRKDTHARHRDRLGNPPSEWSAPISTELNNAAVLEFAEWIRAGLASGGMKIERATGSQMDSLMAALNNGKLLDCFAAKDQGAPSIPIPSEEIEAFATFVLEHSWASAFERATDFSGGEWNFPFDSCAFEFQVSGRRIICCCTSSSLSSTGQPWVVPILRLKSGWAPLPRFFITNGTDFQISKVYASVKNQIDGTLRSALEQMLGEIRAASIALEAEVAVTDVVRAPHRLNRARIRDGKLPKNDYHVISLARRSRTAPVPLDDAFGEREKQRRRLHFRRGHWRHFATHKTWINWMLVGDPDLGFIDKHYRL